MKVTKVLQYDGTEREIAKLFREQIFHSICKGFDNKCQICPFNEMCSDVETILSEIEEKGTLTQKEEM